MEENRKTSQVAGTTSEVEKKLLNGKITTNEARKQLGLEPISETIANELLIKSDKISS